MLFSVITLLVITITYSTFGLDSTAAELSASIVSGCTVTNARQAQEAIAHIWQTTTMATKVAVFVFI